MPNKITCSESRQSAYKAYYQGGQQSLNKQLKIERHRKKHPNDKQKVGTIPDYKGTR